MKNIVFVTQDIEREEALFDWTLDLAKRENAQLIILMVLPEINLKEIYQLGELHPEKIQVQQTDGALADLENLKIKAENYQVKAETQLSRGKSFYKIIQTVLQNRIDLVVKGVFKRKINAAHGFWFVSDDWHLLRKCPCPVLLHRLSIGLPYKKVLVSLDLDLDSEASDPLNQTLLNWAQCLSEDETSLGIVHAIDDSIIDLIRHWDSDFDETDLQRLTSEETFLYEKSLKLEIQSFLSQGDKAASVTSHLLHGNVDEVVSQTAEHEQTQLIVMGTLGRSGLSGMFIGNTAESILQSSACSVLAVKPEGFQTPIRLEAVEKNV